VCFVASIKIKKLQIGHSACDAAIISALLEANKAEFRAQCSMFFYKDDSDSLYIFDAIAVSCFTRG
jgi:hypothetical protein